MKRNQIFLAVAALSAVSGISFAEQHPAGGTSTYTPGTRYIKTNIETKGVNTGKAAVEVVDKALPAEDVADAKGKKYANNSPTAFASMNRVATITKYIKIGSDIVGTDKNGVTVANLYRMTGTGWDLIPKMPDHSHLGRLSYAKVGNHDLYFGDWADVKSGAAKGSAGTNYTVFYSGSDSAAGKMPTTGTAVYAVKGINNHINQGSAVLTGSMVADFSKKTVNGTMAKTGLSIAVNNARIDTQQASFNGAAKANNAVNGTAKGHFFGNQAAAIAGVADFGKNHRFNTAFGGTKK